MRGSLSAALRCRPTIRVLIAQTRTFAENPTARRMAASLVPERALPVRKAQFHQVGVRQGIERTDPPPSGFLRSERSPETIQITELSQEAQDLHRQFRSGENSPADVLRKRIATGTLDVNVARICMYMHVKWIQQRTWTERRDLLQPNNSKLGGEVLKWLLVDEHRWIPILTGEDQQIARDLCCLLVSEDLEKYLIRIICMSLPISTYRKIAPAQLRVWRGRLLRSVIQGHLSTTMKPLSADNAIDQFFRISLEECAAPPSFRLDDLTIEGKNSVDMYPSIEQLRQSLCSLPAWDNTSPDKYDRFVELFKTCNVVHPESLPWRVAEFALYHPTRPTPDAFLSLCVEVPVSVAKPLWQAKFLTHPKRKDSMRFCASRAGALLVYQSRIDEARWLESYVSTILDSGTELQMELPAYAGTKRWLPPVNHSGFVD